VLNITQMEVSPDSPLILSIAYPTGTTISITASAAWCEVTPQYTCVEKFTKVNNITEVRSGPGNRYHLSSTGVLTVRIIEFARYYTGNPTWKVPQYKDPDRWMPNTYALPRFERAGILLPNDSYNNIITIRATCSGTGPYCSGTVSNYDPDVCSKGFVQVAYDKCCNATNRKSCRFADGSTTTTG
jgi:hypothetical protein